MKNQTINKPDKDESLNLSSSTLIGAGCGAIESFLTQPLAALKARRQYGDSFTLNPTVLFRGVLPNVVSMSAVIGIRVTTNNAINKKLFNTTHPSLFQGIVGAFAAAVTSSFLTSTLELGMTQQQKVSITEKASSVFTIYSQLIAEHGFRRILTGIPCIIGRDTWSNSAFLVFTPRFKEIIKSHTSIKNNLYATILAGVPIGLLCAFISHPFDTVKTIQHANADLKITDNLSAWKVVNNSVRKDGLKSLYKGLFWRGIRSGVGVGVLAYSNEQLTHFFRKSY
jgi:hypothetical protein